MKFFRLGVHLHAIMTIIFMKRLLIYLCLPFLTLLCACGNSPETKDVVGKWVNPDGATLIIESNGQFSAHALPSKIFVERGKSGSPLDAQGVWSLKQGEPYWEVKLRFGEILGRPLACEVTVLVSGSGTSTCLYQWEDEEGGNRYKLDRKS